MSSLSASLLDRLRPRLRVHDHAAGHVFYATGDRVGSIVFPCSGAVSLVTELATGQTIEFAMVGRDGVVGGGAALDDRDAGHQALVQVAGRSYSLDVDSARQIARESEEFRTAVMRHEQFILAQASQAAACNAIHDLQQRMARWMLRARDVTGSDAFTLTQEFLAEMLGVQRTSISAVAHSLQEAGLIRYRRGLVSIEQPQALKQHACECYAALRSREELLLRKRAHTETRSAAPVTA